MSDRAPLHPRTWPTWLGLAVLWFVAQWPLRLVRPLGAFLGNLIRWISRHRRTAVARRNIELCFPEMTADQRERMLRANFRSLGVGLFEFLRAWWGPIGRLSALTRIVGAEHVDALMAQGRGVLMLSGHFHTLELCGRILCTRLPLAGMYRPYDNAAFEWAVRRGRARYAAAMFKREELRAAVRHLKRGGILWYAPDQDMRGKDTVFAPFFGIPASSITATHQLARLSGAAVVAFYHRRRRDGLGYEIEIKPALVDFPSDDPVRDTARINALIEDMTRQAPDEYLWVHRRFHRRPEGEDMLY